jgi:hypothetical protein
MKFNSKVEITDVSGENLLFIISQPRSGSTLLQHILASHSEIHTMPEPWLMLHLVYGRRSSGIEAEYNAHYAFLAVEDFLKKITNGEAVYLEALRNMALNLYFEALKSSNKKYFLDKTPRYYLIIPELYKIFPNAKFIFIRRNPLAVFSSIAETNFSGNWNGLFKQDRIHDVLTAPKLILEGIETLGNKAVSIKYEDLVSEPEKTIKFLCDQIGIQFDPEMLTYGKSVKLENTTFIDPKSIYKHEKPVTNYVNGWLERLDTGWKIKLAQSYLKALGEETIIQWGYPYEKLINQLEERRKKLKLWKRHEGIFRVSPSVFWHPLEKLPWWTRLQLASPYWTSRIIQGLFRRFNKIRLKNAPKL